MNGHRVFSPAIDDAGLGTDGVTGDGHALKHRVGIALEHGAIHEGTGIAFVGIADDVLGVTLGTGRKAPLQARGKTRAPSTAKTAGLHLIDHLLGLHRFDGLGQGFVALLGQVIFDALRVDAARIAQHNALLLVEEAVVGTSHALGPSYPLLDIFSSNHHLIEQTINSVGGKLHVDLGLGTRTLDLHQGLAKAHTHATRDTQIHVQLAGGDALFQAGQGFLGPRGYPAGPQPNHDLDLICIIHGCLPQPAQAESSRFR